MEKLGIELELFASKVADSLPLSHSSFSYSWIFKKRVDKMDKEKAEM